LVYGTLSKDIYGRPSAGLLSLKSMICNKWEPIGTRVKNRAKVEVLENFSLNKKYTRALKILKN